MGQLILLSRKYRQNVFNMDNTKKEIKPCVLFYGSIFNHSCVPNIEFNFDYKLKQMIFSSNQKIKRNTELCDHYINITLPFSERKLLLESHYKFTCDCIKCKNKE